jgi:hypothetical protein
MGEGPVGRDQIYGRVCGREDLLLQPEGLRWGMDGTLTG